VKIFSSFSARKGGQNNKGNSVPKRNQDHTRCWIVEKDFLQIREPLGGSIYCDGTIQNRKILSSKFIGALSQKSTACAGKYINLKMSTQW